MTLRTTLRKSVLALGISALSLVGVATALTPAASASTLGTPLLVSNLSVSNVVVVDQNNAGQPSQIWHPAVGSFGGFWTPNSFSPLNPTEIHPNDAISVCATVTANYFTTTAPTGITITGPDYNWTGTVPATTKGTSHVVCTPYYNLNFGHAANLGLISTGYQGVVHPGNECVPIVLKATVSSSSATSVGFAQTDLPTNCGYPTPVIN